MSAAKRLPPLLSGRRVRYCALLVGNGIGQAISAGLVAWCTRAAFDGGGRSAVEPLLGLSLAVVMLAWLRQRERIDAERLGQHYVVEVRERLFGHLVRLPARDMGQRSRGGNVLKFVGDLAALRRWVAQGLAPLAVTGLTLVGACAALAVLSPPLAAGVTGVVAAGAVLISCSGIAIQRTVREARRRRARLTGDVVERLTHLPVIQAFDQGGREWRRVRRRGRDLRDAMIDRAVTIGRIRGLAELTTGAATVAALGIGTRLAGAGELSAGTVVAAIAVVGVLAPAFKGLSRTYEYWNAARISEEVIVRFLRRETADERHARAARRDVTLERGIEFRGVTVRPALTDVSFMLPADSITALVGANGAGKSTVLAAIGGAIVPDAGAVTIDGRATERIPLPELRRLCGWVSPDLPLLKGTLRRNLKYGDPSMTDALLTERLHAAGLECVLGFTGQGLDQRVVEGGVNLSVGQRQLVALARAVVLEPGLLLLDEFDANLDPAHRAVLATTLQRFNGTVVAVTHHRETLHYADHIVHLHAGRVVAAGARDTVLRPAGTVAELFRAVPGRLPASP